MEVDSIDGKGINDTVSIIIPVYNVEKYLGRCLDSVCSQTYQELDIILVDDGSTDSSPRICDDFAARDNRIRVIHKSNCGVSSARNDALDIMTGEWVAFVDSDDYILPGYVEYLLNLLKNNHCLIGNIASSSTSFDELIESHIPEAKEKVIHNYKLHRNYSTYTVWGMMFHKSLLGEKLRFEEKLTYFEDYLFKIELIVNDSSHRYAISDKILYYHEIGNVSSLVAQATKEKLNAQTDFIHEYLQNLVKRSPESFYLLAHNLISLQQKYHQGGNKNGAAKRAIKKEARKLLPKAMISNASFKEKIRYLMALFNIFI